MFSRIGHQGDRRVDALIDRNPPFDEIGFSMVMRLYGHPAVKGIARLVEQRRVTADLYCSGAIHLLIRPKRTYKKRISNLSLYCATFMRHMELPHGLHPANIPRRSLGRLRAD